MSELLDNILPEDTKEEEIKDLTNDQKKKILEAWNEAPPNRPPDLKTLVHLIFGKETDIRSKKGRLIRQYLASLNLKPRLQEQYIPKDKVILTDDQKLYIDNHCNSMTACEMARELFKNNKLTALSQETRSILEYVKTLGDKVVFNKEENEQIPDGVYVPAKSVNRAAVRLNKYILEAINIDELDKNTKVQNILKFVVKALQMFRFNRIINTYTEIRDRELFEASYIKYLWEMPDLNEAELDLVCNLCCDIVSYSTAQSELEDLKRMRDTAADDTEGRRISMSIVESIANIRTELDNNQKRQTKIIDVLQGTRNQRIDTKTKMNASIVQIVDAWQEEKERLRLIKFADDRKKAVREEIQKIDTLDTQLAEIFNLTAGAFD